MNKVTRKLLIAFAFSAVLLLGGANSSFAAECKYKVRNHSGRTVKVVLRYANRYQQTVSKETRKLGHKKAIRLGDMLIGSTVTVAQPGRYLRFTLRLVHAPGCFEWVPTKQKRADDFYRYTFALNNPVKGQIKIYCKEDHKFGDICE